jgi:hypothetical protein
VRVASAVSIAVLSHLALAGAIAAQSVTSEASAAAAETIAVYGQAVDEETGRPLGGVSISVADAALGTLTNAEGRFVLRGVPNENLALRASRTGFIPEMRALWVCTPLVHPPGRCTPVAARDQQMRFHMRSAPPPGRP